MTFSQEVKSEILRSVRNLQGGNATSFLTAVLKSSGSLSLNSNGFAFTLESDNLDLLSLCRNFAYGQLNAEVNISPSKQRAKNQQVYTCTLDSTVGEKLGLIARDKDGTLSLPEDVSRLIPSEANAKRSFLQGLFVASGSVVIPMPQQGDEYSSNTLSSKYHLELRFTDEAFANAVAASFDELSFHFLSRKTHCVLYLKDSEKLADFLVFVNATSASFKLQNVILSRSMRNKTNRENNCIIANIGKTVNAAGKQLDAIAALKESGQFEALPDALKDIARLREKYTEATLDEIADMLSISKSGASHRMHKLIELANKLR